jgi:hypothetical protein
MPDTLWSRGGQGIAFAFATVHSALRESLHLVRLERDGRRIGVRSACGRAWCFRSARNDHFRLQRGLTRI